MTTRDQQIAQRGRGDGQARSWGNLKINTRHLNSDYTLIYLNPERTDTGLLEVFGLITKAQGKPTFRARLDDGKPNNRKDPELDLDILDVAEQVRRDFKSGKNGYAGHHAVRRPDPNHRVFEVEIGTPDGLVFAGDVSFTATFAVEIKITGESSVSIDAEVVRSSRFWRAWRAIRRMFN